MLRTSSNKLTELCELLGSPTPVGFHEVGAKITQGRMDQFTSQIARFQRVKVSSSLHSSPHHL